MILGVTRQSLLENGYELAHKHVKVLDIYVREHFDGELVYERLLKTMQKTGNPYQIISDAGNDVRNGIVSCCNDNMDIIPTYDVTHMIGVVIKHYLDKNLCWQSLQEDLLSVTQQIKQTELSFLRPIALSKKARWLNINKEIEWLENIYHYERKGDFSLIATGYRIENSDEIFEALKSNCKNKYEQKKLAKDLKHQKFVNKETIIEWLKEKGEIDTKNIKIKDAGMVRYEEKFSVLEKHKIFFKELKQLNYVAETIKGMVRKDGLCLDTLQKIEMLYDEITYPAIKQIFNNINNNLQIEHSKCGIDKIPLLCCSEIIESIFGKFKMKTQQTVGGIYQSVLAIVLICHEITPELIKENLSKIKMSDVEEWFLSMSGISNLAKRKMAFK